ncbi:MULTISPECIES: hypothetical protein [unclassified Pseudomonas]|uniref:hypothetical protein n=1 Tax=unclassified Pseudomonas TaxID=196821 RepID=UPI0008E35FC5|nr:MULTISPECIES: hypothetical protein [unclassified Pseudomonas]SFI13747.1 hypothetical protein SAMN03159342_02139 [Pseudomonas sp. NFPP04]SFI64405.1 hypothetical protein SAMN03159344_01440 [Pseudomonas sp. NFPP11]
MNLELINSIACGLIALWAAWCVLSVGKLIYSTIAISGFVVMARSQNIFFGPTSAGLTLHVALALAGARHIFMVTYWQRVTVWLCRTLNCEHCLNCDNPPGGIERRDK